MSKKENVRFLPPVKRYVNAVERRLHLPLREKARVMSDISTSIAAGTRRARVMRPSWRTWARPKP